MTAPFRLDPAFVASYAKRTPPFGFNGLGLLVYLRTYSRVKPDGNKEQWHETVERVVNGCYNMQKRWIEAHSLGWSDIAGQESAQEMYDRIYNFKMCPPGRGLCMMGSPITEERGLFAALNNCGFCTTANIDKEYSKPFCFLMDLSMTGCGIGFDTKGAGKLTIQQPLPSEQVFVIPDTREGWVEALRLTLDAYLKPNQPVVTFDYSVIRPAGQPIRGFGGTASGYGPLQKLLEDIRTDLDKSVGKVISVTDIVNVMNRIGCCVVAGNVRRSAELALGEPDSEEFINLKNYTANPQRMEYGWASNNSIFAQIGMDYSKVAERIAANGEPGLLYLDNMRYYGRMNGVIDAGDHRVAGANPCVSADTMVLTDQGLVAVRDLVGKQFTAVVNGKSYPSTVRGFWKTAEDQQLLRLQLDNGSFVRCTANHQILTKDEKWIEAGELKPGVEVQMNRDATHLAEDGTDLSKVVDITPDGCEDVYDATIPGISRFTANGIIVHNCVEQCLEPYELCCLAEVFIARHDNLNDFLRTLKFAYLYAKTVTLGKTHWPETNKVLLRNRRIGTSVSGIAQFLAKHNTQTLREWLEEGYIEIQKYDRIYSDWLCIPMSVRRTSVKPSGTVSLLAGATPGCHYPESRFYIRRVRLGDASELLPQLRAAGYHIEKDAYSTGTMVVSFPIDAGEGVRTTRDVCMWEQLSLVALLQRCWADNSVSATVTFDPVTEGRQIAPALNYFETQLKAVSFLPRLEAGAYPQMPYEAIDEATYLKMKGSLRTVTLEDTEAAEGERGCDGTSCTLAR